MFKKFFTKEAKKATNDNNILVAAMLVHAAKIDDNYTDAEKNIIKRALSNLYSIAPNQAEKLLIEAEKKEQESNQILEFTKEIKKKPIEIKLKDIIEHTLGKCIISDRY